MMRHNDPHSKNTTGTSHTTPRRKKAALTPEQQEATRTLILRAAAAEFARTGFNHTRMDDIAQAAGIGKGTIYRYVKSKDNLLIQVLQMASSPINRTLHQDVADMSTLAPRARLAAIIAVASHSAHAHAEMIALHTAMTYSHHNTDPAVYAATAGSFREWATSFVEMFMADQHAGQVCASIDPVFLGVFFLSVIHVYQRLPALLGFTEACTPEWDEYLADVLWRGLQPD